LENRQLLSALTVTTAADSGAGSLRAEIAAAHSGDTINFASSLKGQTIVLFSSELLIDKSLKIEGPGANNLAIAGGGSRVFEVDAGVQATLSGLTIKDGIGAAGGMGDVGDPNDGKGGGILNFGTLTVSNCIVTDNQSEAGIPQLSLGGGIYNAGTLSLSGSTVTRNFCDGGGGGIYNTGTLSLSGSSVTKNTATYGEGGGIFNDTTGTLFLTSSNVSNNREVQGNDIYNLGTMTVTKSKR
jgi:predicted outer membrane repeat protein